MFCTKSSQGKGCVVGIRWGGDNKPYQDTTGIVRSWTVLHRRVINSSKKPKIENKSQEYQNPPLPYVYGCGAAAPGGKPNVPELREYLFCWGPTEGGRCRLCLATRRTPPSGPATGPISVRRIPRDAPLWFWLLLVPCRLSDPAISSDESGLHTSDSYVAGDVGTDRNGFPSKYCCGLDTVFRPRGIGASNGTSVGDTTGIAGDIDSYESLYWSDKRR